MNPDKINRVLKEIYERETTTLEEKAILIEACECVWKTNSNKVIDKESFCRLLYENMGFDYDVEVIEDKENTKFLVTTIKKKR